tara:strand:- start:4021 stop:4173 length:153 start_codon:yes stop_codon:yes gene_type:complete
MYHGKMKKDKKRKGSYMGGRQTMKGGGMKQRIAYKHGGVHKEAMPKAKPC